MPERLVSWSGPDPQRVESAYVRLGADSLVAHGASTAPEFVLSYALTTGPQWVTSALDVDARGVGWHRSLALRHVDGTWTAQWYGDDVAGFELPDLTGAIDCDLGLCPLTNSMPVLRHRLIDAAQSGDRSSVEFTMVWVSVPDLAVHISLQTYGAADPVDGGGAQITYASERFATMLEFDADGLIVNYPGLAYRR